MTREYTVRDTFWYVRNKVNKQIYRYLVQSDTWVTLLPELNK